MYGFRWAGIWVLVDGQAGPCMGGGAWVHGILGCLMPIVWDSSIVFTDNSKSNYFSSK